MTTYNYPLPESIYDSLRKIYDSGEFGNLELYVNGQLVAGPEKDKSDTTTPIDEVGGAITKSASSGPVTAEDTWALMLDSKHNLAFITLETESTSPPESINAKIQMTEQVELQPKTRYEYFLAKAAGVDTMMYEPNGETILDVTTRVELQPSTNIEFYWNQIAKNGGISVDDDEGGDSPLKPLIGGQYEEEGSGK